MTYNTSGYYQFNWSCIFLETSEQIQIDDGVSSHLDIHQEDQDDQDVLQVQGCS